MQVPEQLQFMVNARMKQHRSAADVKGKVVVVTGATSGVGLEAARCFVRGGATVVLVCRNPAKAEAVRAELLSDAEAPVEVVLVDFTRLAEVRRAARELRERFPRIDILVNNAGLHCTRRELTPDGLETVFAVNHLASFLLTRLLLDRMQESAPARIIQVNSQGHRFNGLNLKDWNWDCRFYIGIRAYGQSKTAQLMTVWELAEQLEGSGVTINAMHPGSVKSGVGLNNGWLYRTFKKHVIDRTLDDPEISGEAIYWLAADPALEGVSGNFYNLTILEKPAAHALDREIGRKVWALSERLTGLET
jgi:NAD(P)-dependent dehydrogenase (short-subunit alcohol dehydrogenase family)